jgi:hypothetical protein
MMKQIQSRRKFLYKAGILTASLAIPSNTFAISFGDKNMKYSSYSQPTRQEVEKIVANPNYPKNINLKYSIPQNKEGLTGGLNVTRDYCKTKIQIRFKYTKESRLITLLGEEDQTSPKESFQDSANKMKNPSLIKLIENLFVGEIPSESRFEYSDGDIKESLNLKLRKDYSNERVLINGEIHGNNVMVPTFQVDCMRFGERIVPIEILLKYKHKFAFGLGSIKIPMRAVLQV